MKYVEAENACKELSTEEKRYIVEKKSLPGFSIIKTKDGVVVLQPGVMACSPEMLSMAPKLSNQTLEDDDWEAVELKYVDF